MSAEIRTFQLTGKTIDFCVMRPSDGKVWYPLGEVFETYGTGSRTRADYAVTSITEVSPTYYIGNFPTDITTAAAYDVTMTDRAGVNPANDDTPLEIQSISWTGTAEVSEDDSPEVVPESATSIVNYALAKMGGGGADTGFFKIDSINGDDHTATLALMIYPQIRKEVMSRTYWSEATKYADLGDELDDIDKGDWEYAFTMPTDYLSRCRQIEEDFQRSTKPRYSFQYDKEIVQGRLHTNNYSNSDGDSAYIKYVFNLTDVTKFSTLLFNAIATKLAAEMCPVLMADGGNTRRYFLLQEFEALVLPLAIGTNNMDDGDDEDLGDYDAIKARTP